MREVEDGQRLGRKQHQESENLCLGALFQSFFFQSFFFLGRKQHEV